MFGSTHLWSNNRFALCLCVHVCVCVCLCVVFITSSFFCFLIGRQLLKCTSLLEKKGFFFGQFVASNYRFLFHPACCLPLSASYLVRHVWKCLLSQLEWEWMWLESCSWYSIWWLTLISFLNQTPECYFATVALCYLFITRF